MRYPAVDIARGFIIIFMALDHARLFINKSHSNEYWGAKMPDFQGDALSFLVRFISHLSAPGFFFLMGASMAFYCYARTDKGVTSEAIRNHFIVRGAILVLLQFTVVGAAWAIGFISAKVPIESYGAGPTPGDTGRAMLHIGVLASLGFSMLIMAFVLSLSSRVLMLLALATIALPYYFFPAASEVATLFSPIERVLFIPGKTRFIEVAYPIFPWLSVGLLGVVFGRALIGAQKKTYQRLALISVAMIGLFFVLRLGLNVGDYHPAEINNWIDIFNVTKYPPSPQFLLMTLGLGGLILAGFGLKYDKPLEPFTTFGNTALFFYIVHLFLYAILGYLFPMGISLALMLLVWLFGLLVLYPLCIKFSSYKKEKTKTHWVHYF